MFILSQTNNDRVFVRAMKLGRVIVGIAKNQMNESFAHTIYDNCIVAPIVNFHRVRGNAIEVCKRALDRLAVDIDPVHEGYFQFECEKRFDASVVPRC